MLKTPRTEAFLDKAPLPYNPWKVSEIMKFILTTTVQDMLTEKGNYNEQQIIEIYHNYSSDPDSD